jgi:hypothetical protein
MRSVEPASSDAEAAVTRIVIRGYAAVIRDGETITDPSVLRTLAGLVADDELFTEYLGPPDVRGVSPEEKVLARTLEPGGVISFSYHEGDPGLTATTEYSSPRPLTPQELRALVSYTMGQWSDGIGENLYQCPIHDEYDILCLWSKEVVEQCWPSADLGKDCPTVEVTGPPEAVQAWQQMTASHNAADA